MIKIEYMRKCGAIKERFLAAVKPLKYRINGDQEYCIPSTINISFNGVDAESYFVALKENYAFSNGSACNSGSHEPSYVLASMGLDEKRISEAIRISWGPNVEADFTELCGYVQAMV